MAGLPLRRLKRDDHITQQGDRPPVADNIPALGEGNHICGAVSLEVGLIELSDPVIVKQQDA